MEFFSVVQYLTTFMQVSGNPMKAPNSPLSWQTSKEDWQTWPSRPWGKLYTHNQPMENPIFIYVCPYLIIFTSHTNPFRLWTGNSSSKYSTAFLKQLIIYL